MPFAVLYLSKLFQMEIARSGSFKYLLWDSLGIETEIKPTKKCSRSTI